MSNKVTDFLNKIASDENFTSYANLFGETDFDDSPDKIGEKTKVHVSSGSVYGFFAIVTDKSNINALFSEVNNTVNAIDANKTLYPIYWGKDINPGSRIADHVRPRATDGTGNAELEKITALRKFQVIYGSIYVAKYLEFEKFLHDKYPTLVGSPKVGRKAQFTVIDN